MISEAFVKASLADLIWIITNVTFQHWNVVATKVVLDVGMKRSEKWLPFIQTCFCGWSAKSADVDKSSWLLFLLLQVFKGHGDWKSEWFCSSTFLLLFVNYSFATSIGNKIYIWITYTKKWEEVEKFKLHNQAWNAFIFHFLHEIEGSDSIYMSSIRIDT